MYGYRSNGCLYILYIIEVCLKLTINDGDTYQIPIPIQPKPNLKPKRNRNSRSYNWYSVHRLLFIFSYFIKKSFLFLTTKKKVSHTDTLKVLLNILGIHFCLLNWIVECRIKKNISCNLCNNKKKTKKTTTNVSIKHVWFLNLFSCKLLFVVVFNLSGHKVSNKVEKWEVDEIN